MEKLNKLQKDGKIVIHPADKNGGVCVLDRDDYIAEANRQLDDKLTNDKGEEQRYYEKSSEKAVKNQFKEIENVIKEGIDQGYFSKDLGQKLLPEKPKPNNFYLLPKAGQS